MLGQLQEPMGTSQTVLPGGVAYPIAMRRHTCLREFDQGAEGHQRTTEHVEQQVPCAVGERHDPLTDGGADWALPDQAFDQAIDTRSGQDVEEDDPLQEWDHIVSIRADRSARQKVRAQAVGAPATSQRTRSTRM